MSEARSIYGAVVHHPHAHDLSREAWYGIGRVCLRTNIRKWAKGLTSLPKAQVSERIGHHLAGYLVPALDAHEELTPHQREVLDGLSEDWTGTWPELLRATRELCAREES